MKAALRCGWRVEDFFAATPWQLNQAIEAQNDALLHERAMVITGAWHTEAFARCKKLPDLAKLLRPKPSPSDLSARLRNALMTIDTGAQE